MRSIMRRGGVNKHRAEFGAALCDPQLCAQPCVSLPEMSRNVSEDVSIRSLYIITPPPAPLHIKGLKLG